LSGDEFGFDVVFEGAQEMRNGVVLGVDCVAVFFGLWLVVEWECLDDCAQVAELWSLGGGVVLSPDIHTLYYKHQSPPYTTTPSPSSPLHINDFKTHTLPFILISLFSTIQRRSQLLNQEITRQQTRTKQDGEL
jgi:hypothetical protein